MAAGADHPLTFAYPREVGRLSAWVETVLGAATGLLAAGCGLWLGAVFWRRLGLHELSGKLSADYADFRRLKKEVETEEPLLSPSGNLRKSA